MRQQESCAVSCQPSFRERARDQFKLWVGVPLALLLFCIPAYAEPLNEKEKFLEEILENRKEFFSQNLRREVYIEGFGTDWYQEICKTHQLVDITCDREAVSLHFNLGPSAAGGVWIIEIPNSLIKKSKPQNSYSISELLKIRLYKDGSKTGITPWNAEGNDRDFILYTVKDFNRDGDGDLDFTRVSDGIGIGMTIPRMVQAKAVCHLPADPARLSKRKSVFSGTCTSDKDTQKRQ